MASEPAFRPSERAVRCFPGADGGGGRGGGGGHEEPELDPTTQSILSSLEHSPFEKRLIRYQASYPFLVKLLPSLLLLVHYRAERAPGLGNFFSNFTTYALFCLRHIWAGKISFRFFFYFKGVVWTRLRPAEVFID